MITISKKNQLHAGYHSEKVLRVWSEILFESRYKVQLLKYAETTKTGSKPIFKLWTA